jgi:hypothetical protein
MPQSISTVAPHRTLQAMVDTLQEMAVGLEAWAAGRTYNALPCWLAPSGWSACRKPARPSENYWN